MNKAAPGKRIPIRKKGSSELRYSAAVPGYTASIPTDQDTPATQKGLMGGLASTPDLSGGVRPASTPASQLTTINEVEKPDLPESHSHAAVEAPHEVKEFINPGGTYVGDAQQEATGDSKAAKGKATPVTMEAYISQAYARRGQRVTMNTKLEKSLSTHHRLDQAALDRLLMLAQQDQLLLVPRQILLAAMSVESHPLPKRVLSDFVHAVMQRQPIFGSEVCKQALDPVAAVSNIYSLLKSIKSYSPLVRVGADGPSASDLELLRLNALKLMFVWLFHSKGARLEELSAALLQIVWKPAAAELESDVQRLRALTEISEPAAIGWVAGQYLKTATEAQDSEERIRREAVALRADLTDSRCELAVTTTIVDGLRNELEQIRRDSTEVVTALEEEGQRTRTHLSHEIEVMRGRMVLNFRQNIDRLETGLAALNRETPRVAVMVERAEIVIESLKQELKELEGEE
jgi:hypothetical protein